ncbi:hypothetical protein Vafri_21584 [Volvox africanus]|uniref:Uncharacterized protein n=1 Tax=Volvox africanus TaxID=51714 RepID=A0A8J4FF14_9CHLO|nr:hypothetical protein Vafri_21584 [Volvox africanus]
MPVAQLLGSQGCRGVSAVLVVRGFGRQYAPCAINRLNATITRSAPVPVLSKACHATVSDATCGHDPAGSTAFPHVPVMLREVIDAFKPVTMHVYLDCTLGAGGHAAAMVSAHPEMRALLGIDLDPTAHMVAEPRIRAAVAAAAAGRTTELDMHFMRGNYRDLKRLLATVSTALRPNGILMDLGVSSMQIDTAERGFSFMRDGPLDMRMDPNAALSAEEVLNSWSEAELGRIIRDYGEEKMWRVVARRIVQAREVEPIRTTQQLVKAVGHTQILGRGASKGSSKGIHPATRTFQALRIAVNDELHKLDKAVPDAIDALAPGGRLAVISFHSLEDRIVKHAFMRATGRPTPEEEHLVNGPNKFAYLDLLEQRKIADLVARKPVVADASETEANVRARSAKLRVLQKMPDKV